MKKIVVLLVLLTISFSLQAQIPERVKQNLVQLVKRADKESNKEVLATHILRAVSRAPNENAKKAALQFIKLESKSDKVKLVVDALLNNDKSPKKETPTVSTIVLKNANIIDMVTEGVRKGMIVIKEDKIESIDYTNKLKAPAGAKVINLKGKYVIPGLIDGHVHITHGTFEEAKHHLNAALKAGVTGVRDMGGDGRMLTLLKRNTLIGEDEGPDVYFSTIIAGPEFFERDKRPQSVAKGAIAGEVSWQRAITHESNLKQIIAEVKGLGATAIKVYLNVDKDLFKKVADEAKAQGLRVWSHAVVPPTKAIDITNGGSHAMSHAGDLIQYEFIEGDLKGRHDFKTKEEATAYRAKLKSLKWDKNTPEVKRLFTAMQQNNSILDATLHVYNSDRRGPEDLERALNTVKIAHAYGVKIGAGSDNMISEAASKNPVLNIHGELELLTRAGLSNWEALQAATIINAEIVGEQQHLGTIEKGKKANIVVLKANPLKDISNTKKIELVIKRGKLIQ